MAVDTYAHVITHIQTDYADRAWIDQRDSHHLLPIVRKTDKRLKQYGLPVKTVLADGGFGSGFNYAGLESYGITAYIPLPGSYHPVREGFTYDAENDVYRCSQGRILHSQGIRIEKGFGNYYYCSKRSECENCPLKQSCCGKEQRKKLAVRP